MKEECIEENKGGPAPVGPTPITVSAEDFKEMGLGSACATYKRLDESLQDEKRVSSVELEGFKKSLSIARLQRYVDLAGGDLRLGTRLYLWNAALAGALLPTLHMAEVTVRNLALKRVIAKYGKQWYRDSEFIDRRLGRTSQLAIQLNNTYDEEIKRGRRGNLSDYITSELSFGFWVNLFTSKFHGQIWNRPLYSYVPEIPRHVTIDILQAEVEFVRSFRNNVAHHKDLITKPLPDHYKRTVELISTISPKTGMMAERSAFFNQIWECDPRK